ncbi:MAG: hypothetical protein DI536_17355 [Archangium gephyra]|uniref:FG-GAP repeat protein n=1 Tax=Archangium gephyra TaxID=48 RepID=A0A2W5TJA4_9BACT|nr:MAG: hypothetical protein DI536_17355 [Archangium gephyra]
MSLVVALLLAAWPVPRDAGVDAYAQPVNWPNEPGWSEARAFKSYEDGGLRIDRAWSITRGSPDVVLAIAASAVDVSDPVVARAWRLNAAELPTAIDVNGNGRVDPGDLTAPDVNQNGAIDLEDVLAAYADGVDQDGNGRIDDLCGWDFVRDAGIQSRDAGTDWRVLAAPVNDGVEGLGVCPECTLVPLVVDDASLHAAISFPGVSVLMLAVSERDVSAAVNAALDATPAVVISAPSMLPLALHPRVQPGDAIFAGSVGLVRSVAPDAGADQIVGLLGRRDVGFAVERAEQPLPEAPQRLPRFLPLSTSPRREADRCFVEGAELSCDGGLPLAAVLTRPLDADALQAFVRFEERAGPYTWTTLIAAPPQGSNPGQLAPNDFGPGSGPPRFVDLEKARTDVVFAPSREGLRGLGMELRDYTTSLSSGRLAPAFADLDGDAELDFMMLGDDGALKVFDPRRAELSAFARQLAAAPAGPPVVVPTLNGTALVTVDRDGLLTHAVGSTTWTHRLPAPQVSSPAAGRIDRDTTADFAIANGSELHVLISGEFGPSNVSWSRPTRASQALLADLVDDERLEVIVDAVYGPDGSHRLELTGWKPSVVPPAVARLGLGSNRSLVQVEAAGAAWELTRYQIERALRADEPFVAREVLRRLTHPPARGGFVVADFTGDRRPDVLLPTEDGLLFIIDELGDSPPESPMPALGSVLSAPAIGVARDRLELAVRTTRGDVVRWVMRGRLADLVWESAGHDRGNTNNAETPLPARELGGLGITEPPVFAPRPCSCASVPSLAALALLFLLRRASRARR